jgi:tetratricopeptide (TPR) repeat protein
VPPAQEFPAKHPRGRLRQRRSRPGARVFSWAGWACIWALGAGCRDFARPALFPEGAAGEPVVQEQALLGLAPEGDAAVAQLLAAEGAPPRLELLRLDRDSGVATSIERAPPETAREVARRLIAAGTRAEPLLGAAVAAWWPAALERSSALGFAPAAEATLGAQPPPLTLRLAEIQRPRSQALLAGLTPRGAADEVVVARMPLSGEAVPPRLWLSAETAWMLSGSVRGGEGSEPLHRTVGLRCGNLRRAEAGLHDRRGLAHQAAGDREAARRDFDLAVAADPRSVPALYHAAALAALDARPADAMELLQRAVAVDLRLVQVLIRPDDGLRELRRQPEVRALLGLSRRTPAEDQ